MHDQTTAKPHALLAGIDPGKTGALAFSVDGDHWVVYNMPVTDGKVSAPGVFRLLLEQCGPSTQIAVESGILHHTAYHGLSVGVRSYLCAQGRVFGAAQCAALQLGAPAPREVEPFAWKHCWGLVNAEKDAALRLLDRLRLDVVISASEEGKLNGARARKVRHDHADAILIALFARGYHGASSGPVQVHCKIETQRATLRRPRRSRK